MFSKYPMIPVDQALSLVKSYSQGLGSETVPILSSLSRVLYSDIVSPINFPPFRASVMDGYAVRSSDTPGTLKLHESIRPGDLTVTLPESCCVYITTGAAVPDGADAVVPIEEVKILEHAIVMPLCKPAQWIRAIGSDIKIGETIVQKDEALTPQILATLISTGINSVQVYKTPTVGVISTGNELKQIGEPLQFSEITDSNRYMLKMLLQETKCAVQDYGIVKDVYEDLKLVMKKASTECDILITSGGVSMGDHDYVKGIIEQEGAVIFGRVNMKPGKPMTFGKLGNCLVFGLPGNPVSCFVCYYLFVRHSIDILTNSQPFPVVSVTLQSVQKLDPRPEYHRATVYWNGKKFIAESTGPQQSSRLLSTVRANAILIFPQCSSTDLEITGEVSGILIGKFVTKAEDSRPAAAGPGIHKSHHHCHSVKKNIKFGIVTVSDRAFNKVYEDKTGVTHI